MNKWNNPWEQWLMITHKENASRTAEWKIEISHNFWISTCTILHGITSIRKDGNSFNDTKEYCENEKSTMKQDKWQMHHCNVELFSPRIDLATCTFHLHSFTIFCWAWLLGTIKWLKWRCTFDHDVYCQSPIVISKFFRASCFKTSKFC